MTKHRLSISEVGTDGVAWTVVCLEQSLCHREFDEFGDDVGPADECWAKDWFDDGGVPVFLEKPLLGPASFWTVDLSYQDGPVLTPKDTELRSKIRGMFFDAVDASIDGEGTGKPEGIGSGTA